MISKGSLKFSLVCALILWIQSIGHVCADSREYNLKAAYILNFLKFVYWPDSLFEKNSSEINLCMIGADTFGSALNALSHKKISNKSINVFWRESIDKKDDCHVLFFSKSERSVISRYLKEIEHQPILTISDIDDFASLGGMIGFVEENNKIHFEINIDSSMAAEFRFSSKLLEVGRVVRK